MSSIKIIWFTFFHHAIYDDLLNALSKKKGFQVNGVLAKDTADELITYNKLIVRSSNFLPITFFKYIPNFKASYHFLQADVYLINYYSSLRSYQIYRLAKKNKIKLIVCAEEKSREGVLRKIFLGLWDLTIGRSILNYSSLIMPWTDDSENFIKKLTHQKNKITRISAGINTDIFYPNSDRIYHSNGKLRFLMVAKFEKNKGHDTLIEAIQILKKKNFKEFHLTIIGRDSGGLKENVYKKIDNYGLNDLVELNEPIDKSFMRDLYNAFDLLILPSSQEPVGMVVPEAMACGTPVIVSDKVGARYFISEGEDGFIFKSGNPTDLASKIVTLSKQNIKQMGVNGAAKIRSNYSVTKMADRIHAEISKLFE